jgi:hypothetical protein
LKSHEFESIAHHKGYEIDQIVPPH